jgi:hypothetical protein
MPNFSHKKGSSPPPPPPKRGRRSEAYRINGKPSAFILERRTIVKGVEVWTPESWWTDPVQMAKSILKMKAASVLNLGEGNFTEAIKKAHAEIAYLLKEAAPLEPFVIEWADKLKKGDDE